MLFTVVPYVYCTSVHRYQSKNKSKSDVAVQLKLNIFPTTLMGDRRRGFRLDWYEEVRGPCLPFAALSYCI